MPRYKYSGKTLTGDQANGIMTARDVSELQMKLIDKGLFVVSYKLTYSIIQQQLIRTFQRAELTRLTRQIQMLLSNGVPLLESLELAGEQSRNRVIKDIIKNVAQSVESGQSLATAFGEYPVIFDELYISLIRAGELSGLLSTTFDQIALHLEKSEALTRKVRSAIAYPTLVVLVATLVMAAIVIYIVPVFSSMYENFGVELPSLTKSIIGVSVMIRGNLMWLTLALICIVASAAFAFRSKSVTLMRHRLLLRLPLLRNLSTRLISVRFCRTLGMLSKSGIDIITAVHIASKTTGNMYLGNLLAEAQFNLSQGRSFTDSISSFGVFPRTMLRLAASGEKTGRLAEMLLQAADYFEKETESEMNILTSLLEPVIIIVLGVFIAFILISMYLPLFDLAVKL